MKTDSFCLLDRSGHKFRKKIFSTLDGTLKAQVIFFDSSQ